MTGGTGDGERDLDFDLDPIPSRDRKLRGDRDAQYQPCVARECEDK